MKQELLCKNVTEDSINAAADCPVNYTVELDDFFDEVGESDYAFKYSDSFEQMPNVFTRNRNRIDGGSAADRKKLSSSFHHTFRVQL